MYRRSTTGVSISQLCRAGTSLLAPLGGGGAMQYRGSAAIGCPSPLLRASLHHSEISTPDRATIASTNKKELRTPLCHELMSKISVQGMISVSQYMKECLTHPQHGYYVAKKNVIGGDKADFLTAAEIPFFADVLAAWVVDTWQKMGTPRVLNLVELGPGKGSLMSGMLRHIKHMNPQLFHFLQVHLIEVGTERQEEQKKALAEYQTANGKIKWWMDIDSIPYSTEPIIVMSNEYFDALPVAQFQFTDRGWVETSLDIDDDPKNEAHFKYTHAPSGSFTAYLIPDEVRKNGKVGDAIEVNAMGMQMVEKIMQKVIDHGKGACLIVDYGKDEHMKNTLTGIRGHKFVDPLLCPGDIDLSAWVSFKQLRWTLERLEQAKRNLKWFPIMTQADFLEWGGIDVRLAAMLKKEDTKGALRVLQMYRRLMEEEEMGKSYKVFAFQTKNFPNISPYFD